MKMQQQKILAISLNLEKCNSSMTTIAYCANNPSNSRKHGRRRRDGTTYKLQTKHDIEVVLKSSKLKFSSLWLSIASLKHSRSCLKGVPCMVNHSTTEYSFQIIYRNVKAAVHMSIKIKTVMYSNLSDLHGI